MHPTEESRRIRQRVTALGRDPPPQYEPVGRRDHSRIGVQPLPTHRARGRVSRESANGRTVPNRRLRVRLGELLALGLVNEDRSVTTKGYDYLADYTKSVESFLRRYGLSGKK